ncbi:MAG: cytochrome c maturation protein CcmE [Gemmatimonadetes bacterium]|nr:cytochrome c maturation protein CcmE [Gemmatimonadota bacterium]
MNAGRRLRRAVLPAAGLLVVLGGFGYLLYGGLESNLVYFLTPSELVARGAEAYDVPLRLGGQVMPGSVHWDAPALSLTFQMTDGARAVRIRSRGAPPQMFREGIGVVVEGRYRPTGLFESSNLMVKHSNEYRAPHPGERPEALYRTLLRERSGGE